jgi:hypothetical protein
VTAPIANEPPGIEIIPSGAPAVSTATVFGAARTRVQPAMSEIGKNQIIAQVIMRHASPFSL